MCKLPLFLHHPPSLAAKMSFTKDIGAFNKMASLQEWADDKQKLTLFQLELLQARRRSTLAGRTSPEPGKEGR